MVLNSWDVKKAPFIKLFKTRGGFLGSKDVKKSLNRIKFPKIYRVVNWLSNSVMLSKVTICWWQKSLNLKGVKLSFFWTNSE